MTCEACRSWLLEAAPAELRAPPAGVHAHLSQCDVCRAFAERASVQHERIAGALGLVERGYASRPRPSRRTRRVAPVLAGLAAAAAVAALLIARGPDGAVEPLDPPPAALYAALNPSPPVVETPPGVRAAVIRTDRDLTLVLLYSEETLR